MLNVALFNFVALCVVYRLPINICAVPSSCCACCCSINFYGFFVILSVSPFYFRQKTLKARRERPWWHLPARAQLRQLWPCRHRDVTHRPTQLRRLRCFKTKTAAQLILHSAQAKRDKLATTPDKFCFSWSSPLLIWFCMNVQSNDHRMM